MLILGLTGSLGVGKSSVAKMFERLGAKVLDADTMVHQLMQKGKPSYKKVVRTFGKSILTKGEIDRRQLARIVFNDPRSLKKLNKIVHPAVEKDIRKLYLRLRKRKGILIVEAPLLIEAGWNRWMDYCVVVKATRHNQLRRVLKQRSITRGEALKRIKAQMSQKEKEQYADIVIDNNGTLKETQQEVKRIWQVLSARK